MPEPQKDYVIAAAAGRLSHEILNALSGIGGALEVLAEKLPAETGSDAILDRVRAEISRIQLSVAELGTFSTHAQPKLRETDLHDVIDRALERRAAGARVTVSREYSDSLPRVPVDDVLFQDALQRLFRNADDAMPNGGTLTVRTGVVGARVRVEVTNTGSTVPPEHLANAFEPFYTSKTHGLGLGLAIARRHIEAHGGTIEAAPRPDGGSEFVMTLPLTHPRPRSGPPPGGRPP